MRTFICLIGIHLALSVYAQLDTSRVNEEIPSALLRLEDSIADGKYERITSVLIAQSGQLIYEKYFDDTNQATLHNTRSATKTIATFLIGISIQEGFISSVEDPILDYLAPRNPIQAMDDRKAAITIQDLLTMSSLFECDDWNYFSRGNEERMYIIEDWTQFLLDLPIRSFPFGPPPDERPFGRAFSYCSAGAAALAEVTEAAAKSPADKLIQEKLFRPLGIRNYRLDRSPMGRLNTAGGSGYRSRDLIKLIELLRKKGSWNNNQVVSSDWVSEATSPKAQVDENTEYGYLIWLKKLGSKEHDTYYMSGNGGQRVMAIPSLGLSVVITTTNYGNRNAHRYSDEIISDYIIPTFEKH